jgi:dUTPase
MEEVKIKLNDGIMPKKATGYSAAYDLFCPKDMFLESTPGARGLIPLGFQVQMPKNICMNIRPRSGFSLKGFEAKVCYYDEFGYIVHEEENVRIDADCSIGLVDSDYVKDEVGVIYRINNVDFRKPKARYAYFKIIVHKGARIAQAQFEIVPQIKLVSANELDYSNDRGGGFGHTGTK